MAVAIVEAVRSDAAQDGDAQPAGRNLTGSSPLGGGRCRKYDPAGLGSDARLALPRRRGDPADPGELGPYGAGKRRTRSRSGGGLGRRPRRTWSTECRSSRRGRGTCGLACVPLHGGRCAAKNPARRPVLAGIASRSGGSSLPDPLGQPLGVEAAEAHLLQSAMPAHLAEDVRTAAVAAPDGLTPAEHATDTSRRVFLLQRICGASVRAEGEESQTYDAEAPRDIVQQEAAPLKVPVSEPAQ